MRWARWVILMVQRVVGWWWVQLNSKGGGDFAGSQAQCHFIEYRVHILVTIGPAKRLGQFNRLIEHDSPRHIQAVLQLIHAQPHHRALDGREVAQGTIDERGDDGVQGVAFLRATVQDGAVVGQVGFFKAHQVLRKEVNLGGVVVGDNELVERLQGEFTRACARTFVGFAALC